MAATITWLPARAARVAKAQADPRTLGSAIRIFTAHMGAPARGPDRPDQKTTGPASIARGPELLGLISLDQVLDPDRINLPVTVADDRI